MQYREPGRSIAARVGSVVVAAVGLLPPNIIVSATDRALLFNSDGTIVSTATLCPGERFDTFGATGPRLSPDQHWALVDVVGPFVPGNVMRRHALVDVRSGNVIFARDFPSAVHAPMTNDPLAWASGERESLRYNDGRTVALGSPPSVTPRRCAVATNRT